jgi:hypothetical protein
VEAIGILEELLRIKKINFGINSKEVRNKGLRSNNVLIVYQIMQTVM